MKVGSELPTLGTNCGWLRHVAPRLLRLRGDRRCEQWVVKRCTKIKAVPKSHRLHEAGGTYADEGEECARNCHLNTRVEECIDRTNDVMTVV